MSVWTSRRSTPLRPEDSRPGSAPSSGPRQEDEDETNTLYNKRQARLAEEAKANDPRRGETSDKWHGRYLKDCEARGLTTVRDKKYRWSKWISPKLGAIPMREVTSANVEDVRDALDDAIRDGRLSWKTASNVWGELTVSFDEAKNSKRRDLRIIETNPAAGVRAPETGGDKAKVYPYPSEFLAIAACEDVPLEWRELHTIAAYTYLRPGELYVLEWPDVDLADRVIRVTKAWNYAEKRTKSTKTHETRDVPVDLNLLPLLERMHKRAGGKGLVVPLLASQNEDTVAETTRAHFEAAKCKRQRLYTNTPAERHVIFRSWRDAGITWSIVRGDDVVKVQRRAGHKLIGTTMRYVVEAENRGATFGTPFPPLPRELVDPKSKRRRGRRVSRDRATIGPSPARPPNLPTFLVHGKGVEPLRLAAAEPKSAASANFATRALRTRPSTTPKGTFPPRFRVFRTARRCRERACWPLHRAHAFRDRPTGLRVSSRFADARPIVVK